MAVISTELHWETDYLREAGCMEKFRSATSLIIPYLDPTCVLENEV